MYITHISSRYNEKWQLFYFPKKKTVIPPIRHRALAYRVQFHLFTVQFNNLSRRFNKKTDLHIKTQQYLWKYIYIHSNISIRYQITSRSEEFTSTWGLLDFLLCPFGVVLRPDGEVIYYEKVKSFCVHCRREIHHWQWLLPVQLTAEPVIRSLSRWFCSPNCSGMFDCRSLKWTFPLWK